MSELNPRPYAGYLGAPISEERPDLVHPMSRGKSVFATMPALSVRILHVVREVFLVLDSRLMLSADKQVLSV